MSNSVSKRIPEPFVILNQSDAERLNVADNDFVQLEIGEVTSEIKFRVKTENSVQPGIAGVPVNLPGMPFIDLPAYMKFKKVENSHIDT